MLTTSYIQHSCTVNEHRLTVPLDPTGALYPGRTIEVFAREIIRPGGENLPHLLFLQGGPGGAGPRVGDFRDGWTGEALKDYRIVLLDQRGTGQSTPLSADVVAVEDDPATFLSLFLQTQILYDAEAFREELANGAQWSTLGQSYGGFLTLAYLSNYPGALKESFITGGLPGLGAIEDIYRHTYPLTAARNREYLRRYPQDEQTIRHVAAHLLEVEEHLPTGERLTPTRLRSVGMALGGNMSYDLMHYLWENPFVTIGGKRRLSLQFLADVGGRVTQASSPLFWVLQEAIYASSTTIATGKGTRWAAERVAGEFEGFDVGADPLDMSAPWYLSAEHTFRPLIAEDPALSPMLDAVDELATRTNWPKVYDLDLLKNADIPIAALVYYNDIYVPRQLSLQTADLLPNARTWVTSEMHHDGLRADGKKVFGGLRDLLRD